MGALGYVACNKALIGNPESNVIVTLSLFFFYFVLLNIGLAVFNLIPVPPLDGSKIVSSLLPPLAAAKYLRIELYTRYIFLALILLSWLPAPLDVINDAIWFPIQWLRNTIYYGFTGLWAALLGLF